MKKKQKTTTNQTTNQVTTPTNPEWVTSGVQDQQKNIQDFFKTFDPSKLAPGADPLQTQAATAAGGLTSSPNFGRATDILGGVAGAGPQSLDRVDIASLIPQFMNPYLKDVVDTSLTNYDEGAGQSRAQNRLALAGDPTFGGSGGAIQTALLERGLTNDRAKLAAGLRSQAFDTAAGLAGQQAGLDTSRNAGNASLAEQALARQAAAAGGLADIGATQGADARANIGTQAQLGDIMRQILASQGKAGLDALTAQTGLIGSLPYNLFNGQNTNATTNGTSTTTTSGASLGDIAKLVGGAALAFGTGGLGLAGLGALSPTGATAGMGAIVSDRRAKTDISKVGKLDNGLNVYRYRYKAGGPEHIGVMAQEVAKRKPEAVVDLGGLMAVDYGKL